MKRSHKFRACHKAISLYHTSKHSHNPEQCPAHFREPLSEIESSVYYWNKCSFTKRYVSPMIESNTELYFSAIYKDKPLYFQSFSRYDRSVRSKNGDTIYKNNSDRRDARRGIDYDYRQEALDYICGVEFFDEDLYFYELDNMSDFYSELEELEHLAWKSYKKVQYMKDYPKNVLKYKDTLKIVEENYSYRMHGMQQLDLEDKIDLCPDNCESHSVAA